MRALADEKDSDEILTQGGLFNCSDRKGAALYLSVSVVYAGWARNGLRVLERFIMYFPNQLKCALIPYDMSAPIEL